MKEVLTPSSLQTPFIFRDTSVNLVMTRRSPDNPMSGNVTRSPAVLTESHRILAPEMEVEDWIIEQQRDADERVADLQRTLGLQAISHPVPEHGTAFIPIATPDDIARTDWRLPRADVPHADVAFTDQPEVGLMVAPADCPVIVTSWQQPSSNIVHPAIGTIHAGYRGLANGVIESGVTAIEEQLPKRRRNREFARVYVTPHARDGFTLHGEPADLLDSHGFGKYLTKLDPQPDDDHVAYSFNMTGAVEDQLKAQGFKHKHVEVSPINTLKDRAYFSQRNRHQKGANGRNGLVVAIKKPFHWL